MNVALTASSPTPVFTVGSALRWLGHDCPDHRCCYAPIDTLSASVWFLRRGPQCRTFPQHTRVLVEDTDFPDTATSIRWLIYHAHACTARDGIEVRYAPGCTGDRPSPVPHQEPVAVLSCYRPTPPFTTPGPGDPDQRFIVGASLC